MTNPGARSWFATLALLLGCESGGPRSTAMPPATARRLPPSSILVQGAPSASAAALPSAKAAPAPAPASKRYRLRPIKDASPWQYRNAVEPVAKRFTPKEKRRPNGDGCAKPLAILAQGVFEGLPVRATITVLGKKLAVSLGKPGGGARTTYRGEMDQSFCDHAGDGDLLGMFAPLTAPGGKPPLTASLRRISYFEADRLRLRLEAATKDSSENTLDLWDIAPEREDLLDLYQAALGQVDVEAVLEGESAAKFVAYLTLGDRELHIAEVRGSPPRLVRETATGLRCSYHECNAGLAAFALMPGHTLFVATISGQNCSAKCASFADGQLLTLDAEGFHHGVDLPESDEYIGGLNYEGSSSHTTLRWADGDGAPPLEILVEHSMSDEGTPTRTLHGYDASTKAYSFVEAPPALTAAELDGLAGGEVVAF